MKNLKQVLGIIIFLLIISACEIHNNDAPELLNRKAVSAKWMVAGDSVYKSFEFNLSSNYLVVKKTTSGNSPVVLFGTYQIVDNQTVLLSDFGTVKITGLHGNSIDFSVRLNSDPATDITFSAAKHTEMAGSERTNSICRTWKISSVNGISVVGTKMELTLLFSAAGSYFVSYAVKIDESDGKLAEWKWNDETQTRLLYSWNEVPDWDEAGSVEIPQVTADSLVIIDNKNRVVLKPFATPSLP